MLVLARHPAGRDFDNIIGSCLYKIATGRGGGLDCQEDDAQFSLPYERSVIPGSSIYQKKDPRVDGMLNADVAAPLPCFIV